MQKIKCKQEGCPVSINGSCLEGLPISSCVHAYEVEEEAESDINEDSLNSEENAKFQEVYSGDALQLEECNYITSSSVSRLVILAGKVFTGKTTLLCSLFQMFQNQVSFADYFFAGSSTLIGFEKRCYESRISSGRQNEETQRTKIAPPEILHLCVKKHEDPKINILFTDISGEFFDQLCNSTEECKKFTLAKRADHFALFIDADQLSNLNERNGTKVNSLGILRSLVDSEMILPNTFIEIVFSRWDLLAEKPEVKKHIAFVNSLKAEIQSKYSEVYKNIEFYEIASRPRNREAFKFGHGIGPLLSRWAEKSKYDLQDNAIEKMTIKVDKTQREFSKYKFYSE